LGLEAGSGGRDFREYEKEDNFGKGGSACHTCPAYHRS
jgi:hypothetical protein